MSMVIPIQIEKCKGAMLATAIGDALGWPNEPRSKNRTKSPKVVDHFVEWTRSSNNPRWHDEKILPGEYSDDTQLTLSVARSIITGNWENFFAEKELPFWLNYERGGGGALLKAAKSCRKGLLLWQSQYNRDYFNAGGNGAVMRILPHVIASAKTADTTKLMLDVIKDTLITHGHPRAFLGATCYAYALDYLLKKDTVLEYGELVTAVIDGQNVWGAALDPDVFGKWLNVAKQCHDYDFSVEWKNVRDRMVRQLEFIRGSLKKGLILEDIKVLTDLECFDKSNGAGDVAVLSAIYLASRYANNPSLGIKIPAFLFGADTDTIASITGGLLGMLSGMNWIPTEWRDVQDYNCLIKMTELLMADDKKEATKKEVAEIKTQNNQWKATPIGKIRFIESKSVPNGKNGIVIIEKWQTILGQTLYTKTFQPKEMSSQLHPFEEQMSAHQQVFSYSGPDSQMQNESSLTSMTLSQITKPRQQNIAVPKESKQFALNLTDISDLLDNPQFKTSITIGKTLKIIRSLINGEEIRANIAKKYNVEQSFVEEIEKHVT